VRRDVERRLSRLRERREGEKEREKEDASACFPRFKIFTKNRISAVHINEGRGEQQLKQYINDFWEYSWFI
jgi:hypothetical protein